MIRFACPGCRTVIGIPDEHAGARVSCGKCGAVLQAPSPPTAAIPVVGPAPPDQAPPLRARVHAWARRRPWHAAGLVTAVALSLSFLLCGIGPGRLAGRRIYDRDAFEREIRGLALDEVRRKLGAPDQITGPRRADDIPGLPPRREDEGFWLYRSRTRNPRSGAVDEWVTLSVERGRVARMDFQPR